jgi:hypothetical protein
MEVPKLLYSRSSIYLVHLSIDREKFFRCVNGVPNRPDPFPVTYMDRVSDRLDPVYDRALICGEARGLCYTVSP